MLVVHAFEGCDTTSSIFGHGKGSVFSKVSKDSSLQTCCATLQSNAASVEEVCEAGLDLVVALYGGKRGDELSSLRYSSYCSTSLKNRFQPERLPPSEGAARMHAMRVHLQAVVWGNLGETALKPTDWGWKIERDRLVPIHIVGDVAPENILKVVRCKCKSNCSSALCSCRQHGLHCVSACSTCHGNDCTNSRVDVSGAYKSDSDSESEISNADENDFNTPDFDWDADPCFEYYEEVL